MLFHSDRPAEELAELVQETGADGFIAKTANAVLFAAEVARYVGGG